MNNRTRLCLQPWNTINVGADGVVYPCCVAVDDMIIGNLADSTLEDIITGPKMAEIRERLTSGRLTGACVECQNAGPTTVKAFERTLNLHLSATASETGKRDRLVMIPAAEQDLHAIGMLKVATQALPGNEEEIEIYSDFSPDSYLEGKVDLRQDFTIGLWIKPVASPEAGILLHHAAFRSGSWIGPVIEMTTDPAGRVNVVLCPNGYEKPHVFGAELPTAHVWIHLALAKQGDTAAIFVNGEQVVAHPSPEESFANDEAVMRVGVNAAPGRGNSFGGAIAGLFVESERLSNASIRAVYEAERPVFA